MGDTALITRPKVARLLDFFPLKADKPSSFIGSAVESALLRRASASAHSFLNT